MERERDGTVEREEEKKKASDLKGWISSHPVSASSERGMKGIERKKETSSECLPTTAEL